MRLTVVGQIECEVEGHVYLGTYQVTRGVLKVTMRGHSAKCATPGSRPEVTAKAMLRELAEEAKRTGGI